MAAARKSQDDTETTIAPAPVAPFGWNLVGEDGRRILRYQTREACLELAGRIAGTTGETCKTVPAEIT